MRSHPHQRFSRDITLDERMISSFAAAAGDGNPIHHDPKAARQNGYGGIIASGPHTSALLMGLVASHFSQSGPMVGLDFSFFFKAPVPANVPLRLEWLVIRVTPTRSGQSEIAELRGRLQIEGGLTGVGARGTALLSPPNLSRQN